MSRHRIALEAAAVAALVFLPYLGSVGLWDPWETHYAEVARQMLVRGDLIHPYWESSWFFSKPVLAFWLMVPGLWLTGAAVPGAELSPYTEWLVRLPFALLAIAAVALLADAIARASSSPRAGRVTAVALSTMPMFFFVARQAMTDMAYVAPITICLAAAIRALFTETEPKARDRWWRVAFAAAGVATLGKGMLGFGLPALVLAAFLAIDLKRARGVLREIPWRDGLGLWALIALPWYLAMFSFDGVDAEGLTFFRRFIVHDHFARLGSGVHTTTPGGSFTYFVEQLGFGLFPWVALVPAALAGAMVRSPPLQRLLLLWAVLSFGLFSASATRFHHYVLPALPAIAALIALSRPRPMALVAGAVLLGLVTKDLATSPRHFVELFTYNHERAYPAFLWTARSSLALGVGALACVLAWALRRRVSPQTATGAFALVLAVWLSSVHWVELSHHWTQRDLFWRYFRGRAPGEPIAAFWMNWKGETFYSRNEVVQVKPGNEALALELARRPGRAWFLVEHPRLRALQQALGPSQQLEAIEPSLNDKFVLVVASETWADARTPHP